MYVIRRNDGAFVVEPGMQHSYTDKLQDAWTFPTRESAQRNSCPENERVVSVADIMNRRYQ